MNYKIVVNNIQGNRAYLTFHELNAQSEETGRYWSEPFGLQNPDYIELEARLKQRIADSDASDTEKTSLVADITKNIDLSTV